MSEKPSQILQKQYDENLRRSQIFGINSPDGLFNRRLLFVLGSCAVEPIMHFNGLYQHWPIVPQICSSLAIACLIILLLVRLGSILFRKDEDKVKRLFESTLTFYEQEEQNETHSLILDKYVKMFNFFIISYEIVAFVLLFIPNSTSWILSWYIDEFMLVAPIYLPFTDPQTLIGYIINSALLTYYSMILYICFVTGDLAYIFYVYQYIPKIQVFCIKWQKFNSDLLKVKMTKNVAVHSAEPSVSKGIKNVCGSAYQKILAHDKAKEVAKVEQELITLIKEFNSFNEYVKETVMLMELTTFAAITLNSMAIAMSLIVLLQYSKAIGACIMVFLIFQVLIPCVLGAVISQQKKKLLNELYGFQWYELSLAKQKIFLQFLHVIQSSNEFKLPLIGNINMVLFTGVINATYSYFMYLFKFVKL